MKHIVNCFTTAHRCILPVLERRCNLGKFFIFHEVIIIQNIEILQLSPGKSGSVRAVISALSLPAEEAVSV